VYFFFGRTNSDKPLKSRIKNKNHLNFCLPTDESSAIKEEKKVVYVYIGGICDYLFNKNVDAGAAKSAIIGQTYINGVFADMSLASLSAGPSLQAHHIYHYVNNGYANLFLISGDGLIIRRLVEGYPETTIDRIDDAANYCLTFFSIWDDLAPKAFFPSILEYRDIMTGQVNGVDPQWVLMNLINVEIKTEAMRQKLSI
jgi:hypothetical protein